MNRDMLKGLLHREGVDPSAYSLEGGMPFEAYVLEQRPTAWVVFYSERGIRTGEVEFATEDEACSYLLDLVLRDPTTRQQT